MEDTFRGLLTDGEILHSDGLEAIYNDADAHKEAYCYPEAFEEVKDRNLCIIDGAYDDIAPGKLMVMPLWNRLKVHQTTAVQKHKTFDCEHYMCNVRFQVVTYIGEFIKEVLGE